MKRVVAVITPYHRLFYIWLKDNEEEDTEYICANRVDAVRGRRIDSVEYGIDADKVHDEVHRKVNFRLYNI